MLKNLLKCKYCFVNTYSIGKCDVFFVLFGGELEISCFSSVLDIAINDSNFLVFNFVLKRSLEYLDI